jgi:quinol monooxygenase YgiN
MFARIVEFTPRPEAKEEIVNILRKDVLPILKKQQGLTEFLPLIPENKTEKWVSVTLWAEKRDAERYEREVYPKVEGILKPYLLSTVVHTHFNLEATFCKYFVEALTA